STSVPLCPIAEHNQGPVAVLLNGKQPALARPRQRRSAGGGMSAFRHTKAATRAGRRKPRRIRAGRRVWAQRAAALREGHASGRRRPFRRVLQAIHRRTAGQHAPIPDGRGGPRPALLTPSDPETSDRQQDPYRLRRTRFRAEKEPEARFTKMGVSRFDQKVPRKDVLMIDRWPSGASEAVRDTKYRTARA